MKRLITALLLVATASGAAGSITAPARFNDKMLIDHKGKQICVDWAAWEGHMHMRHGDILLGSCDVPEQPEG